MGKKLDETTLRIPGLDINWEEIELNAEQAVTENNINVDRIVTVTLV